MNKKELLCSKALVNVYRQVSFNLMYKKIKSKNIKTYILYIFFCNMQKCV